MGDPLMERQAQITHKDLRNVLGSLLVAAGGLLLLKLAAGGVFLQMTAAARTLLSIGSPMIPSHCGRLRRRWGWTARVEKDWRRMAS
jgi:hypothetical protein